MNYTKCDFTPIIGAEVKIRIEKGSLYNGKLLGGEKNKHRLANFDVLAVRTREFGLIHFVSPSGIVSVKATMKPKDMNQEQLHRLAEEIAMEHYGDRYDGIESITFNFDERGELSDEICVDLRGMTPEDGFVLDPNRPVDVTHWLKEDDHA